MKKYLLTLHQSGSRECTCACVACRCWDPLLECRGLMSTCRAAYVSTMLTLTVHLTTHTYTNTACCRKSKHACVIQSTRNMLQIISWRVEGTDFKPMSVLLVQASFINWIWWSYFRLKNWTSEPLWRQKRVEIKTFGFNCNNLCLPMFSPWLILSSLFLHMLSTWLLFFVFELS